MKILVANLGSTSFKFRLFEMSAELVATEIAKGAVERIGAAESAFRFESGRGATQAGTTSAPNHARALEFFVDLLQKQGLLADASELTGVGFKAVHGGRYSGVQRIDDDVLAAMEEVNDVAPVHNPIYVAAIRQLAAAFPQVPLVAAFETGFHLQRPPAHTHYAVPQSWHDQWGIRRWGFHGASHRYIAERMQQLVPDAKRVISLHLGGSSSLCAIRDGRSVDTSMGMSPQSGVAQGARCGDLDPFVLPALMRQSGWELKEVFDQLAVNSGLAGLSGISGDIRDLEAAAEQGRAAARLALDVYVVDIRRQLGAMLAVLGGADACVFTGGTGENASRIRLAVCAGLAELGIEANPEAQNRPGEEFSIHRDSSRVQLWVVPTNEEQVVARQTAECLQMSAK